MENPSYSDQLAMTRHFTSTGYIVSKGSVLLHWHPKVKAFLPPGGHVEINEDPVEAVLREVKEETGLLVEIINSELPIKSSYPAQIPPPITIMIEDITDSDGRIVWIVGLTVAHQFRITEHTQSVIFLESKKLGVQE